MPPKQPEKKRRNKRKARTEVSSSPSSSDISEPDIPSPTTKSQTKSPTSNIKKTVRKQGSDEDEVEGKVSLNPNSRPPPPSKPTNELFEEFYLRQATREFAEDLDKLRSAGDFNAKSLPILIAALKQGVATFGGEEKGKVVAGEMGR